MIPPLTVPPPRFWISNRTRVPLVVLLWGLGAVLAGCGGATRSDVAVTPTLSAARLGSVRGALTYDGDWVGGMPGRESLVEDLELADRRGVALVLDLRPEARKRALSLLDPVTDLGMQLVEITLRGTKTTPEAEEPVEFGPITEYAVERVLDQLSREGRRRALLLDENGRDASVLYAIHLAVNKGVSVADALRAARATGLDDDNAEFVQRQVERYRKR